MKYLYEVLYLDSRDSHLRTVEVEAEDNSDAFNQACIDDYYFGTLISIDKQYEISEEGNSIKVFDTFEKVDGMQPCVKKPVIVQFKQINQPFQVLTLEGNYKTGKAGDYLIKGVDGELYIHDKQIFDKVYTRLAPNTKEIVDAIESMEIGDSITFKL